MTDAEIYFSLEQIAKHVGRGMTQVRLHAQKGWLKVAPKRPGLKAHRVTLTNANRWIALHHPKAGPMTSPFQST
ncbi:hypothetical protein [Verrucomicrobium sp. BvORR106]|uniref:hypothetical protein n=1 Tax=Verrucomicrobium sp. BvORR106 TaxID=1403819 RepID=UPI00056E2B8D|nr:hypothetical protein [Verrucomicrobium sp. BvORR106]